MKPSDVVISGLPPFIGMFGSCEAEVMAACMVKTLAVNGDEFRAVELAEIAKTIGDLAQVPCSYWRALLTNPFTRPSIERLAIIRDDEYGKYQYVEQCGGGYRFTFAGLLRLSKRVKP